MTPLAELIGESPGIVAVRDQIGRLLQRHSDRGRLPPILILGETGTGKGLLARAIHRTGSRADGPFVDVNCAAIPETLLEAELFGFERGAFTDAKQGKAGLFQVANRGTIFLDELGLLPLGLQAKLLKVLEERAVRRLGGTRNEPVDVWIMTATSEDLLTATRAGRFREDLYHRLAVVTISLPPLRERGPDILVLAEHFLARACADYHLPPKTVSPNARAALLAYGWPGNIRELGNVAERVALLSEAPVVTAELLGLPGAATPPAADDAAPAERTTRLEDAVGSVERQHLLEALRETHWNITRAAEQLGISRDTLRYRITKHGLRPDGPPRPPRRPPARPAAATAASTPAAPAAASAVAAPPEVVGPSTVRWEPRRLTFFRAALVSPETSDPRIYPSRAAEVLVEKVESFGGRVEELGPTGLVATFGLEPIEDAPRRAAHAAMAIQKAVERARQSESDRIAVKGAIHVSQLLVSQGSGAVQIDLDGKRHAWTTLESLMSRAERDDVTVSHAAAPFLERHFDLVPAGAGEPSFGRVYRLTPTEGLGPRLGRREAPFVGRRHEFELLRSRLASAMRGRGQVVGILGEAGIGKSRLLAEFRRSLEGEWVTYREGHCQSYGSAIPYLPLLDILRQNFRITDLDHPEAIAEKVRLSLEHVGMDAAEWAPYFLRLFGVKDASDRLATLTPGAIKARTFEALRELTLIGSDRRPSVFVMEDLQWIDTTTEECLAALMESAVGTPALLIVTYRPGYRPPWVDKSYVTQVALQPLSPEDSLSVAQAVLQRDDIPEALAKVLLKRTEGNPFFLEELCRAIAETGELRLPATVPDTIQEVLLARLSRLPEEPRRLLETASVLGREVPLPLLRAMWEGLGDLDPLLRELTRGEFLSKRSGEVEPVYAFTHALTQEVAYESLPVARRRTLHAAAGRALETLYADRLEELYDRLAYHYSRTDEAGRAVEYLTCSAARAARAHAHTEAVRALEEAVGHIERLPVATRDRTLLGLVLQQAYSLIPLGRFQAVVDLLLRYQADLERLQEPALVGPYHFLLSRSYLFLGDDERAARHALRAITEATRCGDQATLGKIHYVLAQRGAMSGHTQDGLEHGRQAAALLERAGETWWVGPAYWAIGLNHALRGEFAPALEAEARAAAIGETVGDPQLQSSAAWAVGAIHAAMGDGHAGLAACQRAVERAPDPLDAALALGWLGYASVEQGDAVRAIPLLERSVRELGQFRFPQPQGWFTVFLAEAYRQDGQLDLANNLAREGARLAQESSSLHGIGWAERALGRIAQARGALRDAEAHLGEALRTFVAVEARYEVARTHLDLAALAHARGDPVAATRHLDEARQLFATLGVPRYIERTEALASELRAAR